MTPTKRQQILLEISPIILFFYLLLEDNLIKSFKDIALCPQRLVSPPPCLPILILRAPNVNKVFIMATMFSSLCSRSFGKLVFRSKTRCLLSMARNERKRIEEVLFVCFSLHVRMLRTCFWGKCQASPSTHLVHGFSVLFIK